MNPAKKLKTGNTKLRPILSEELTENLPLTDVFIGRIKNPKTISQVIRQLNLAVPLTDFQHLKRVRGNDILLLPKEIPEIQVLKYLQDRKFDINLIDDIRTISVAKVPPKVRQQFQVVNLLWPCNFHSNPYLEKLSTNSMFSESELNQHCRFMTAAIEVSEILSVNETTIIVDPLIESIVAFGYDQTEEYPTKHSIMVAIDEVARTQNGGAWKRHENYTKIENYLKEKHKYGFGTTNEGPYLCTGFYVYSTIEPCITCAMALIHSRAKRVFYGRTNSKGGLGTLCNIHLVANLNHHYEVFAGLLEDQCRLLQ